MRRYWVPAEAVSTDQVDFSDEVFHHIFDVCRQEVGSKFEVLTGNQQAYLVEVTQVGKKRAQARRLETRQLPPLKKPYLVLALSICRYHVMDAIVEKAVEMGVTRIQPFFSEQSFIRKANSLPAGKLDRWEKIVKSATQQCGRGDLMPIAKPMDLAEIRSIFNPDQRQLGLFAYEGASTQGLKDCLKPSLGLEKPEEIWVFVGSEGGFSQTEVQLFKNWGLESISLGEQVLRVETACITLLAILKYEFDLMRSGGTS